MLLTLGRTTSAQQLEDQHEQGEHQQQVNETRPETADQAKQPEDEQDDDDRPEHRVPPFHRHTPSAVMTNDMHAACQTGRKAWLTSGALVALVDDLRHEEDG